MARSKKAQDALDQMTGTGMGTGADVNEFQVEREDGQGEVFGDALLQVEPGGDQAEVPGGTPPKAGSELDDFPGGETLGEQASLGSETSLQTEVEPRPEPVEAGDPLQVEQGNVENTVNQAAPGTLTEPAQGVGQRDPGPTQETPGEAAPEAGQPARKVRLPGRGPRVVSIDAQRSVETDADRLRNDLLDLIESMKGKKILSDTIQGVERPSPNSELSYAVIYHGEFKVIIPVLEVVEEPEDYRGQAKGDVLHYLLNKRLGAEIDYIVKGVDSESGIAVASRLDAMAMKRKEYYFRTDRDGNYQIYEGIRAEARVVSVIRAGIFIDLFGAECYIPLKELSYQRWLDAAAHYQPGQRVLVKVLEVDRSDRNRPRISASVKQAGDNPYEKALQRYVVGCLYVGSVSLVDLTGVFVSLDGGIDCLCSHPKRGRPPRGARVTVRILGMDHDTNRIWGVITHMSTAR